MNRPLVWIAAAFTAGIYAGSSGMSGGWIPPLLLCVAVLAAMPLWRHPQYRAFSVVLLFAGAGMLLWEVRHDGPAGDSLSRYVASHPEATYQFEGRVRRPDLLVPGQERFSFFFEVDRVLSEDGPEAVHGMVYVRWQAPESPVYADDRLRITAPLELRLSEVNPGVEGFEDYLRRLGVHTKAHIWQAGAVERLAPGRWWCIPYWAARLRNIEAVYLSKTVPEETLPFILTVWLGQNGWIDDAEYQAYLDSGTAHILAVSGINVTIVYMSAGFLLAFFMRNRRYRSAVLIAVVFLFALMAGARVSSLRAALMVASYLLADLLDRESDASSALALAALILLLISPDTLFDRSFLLSFSSIASILMFHERVARRLDWMPYVLRQGGLPMSISVQVLPFPLAVHFFHVVPWIGLLANLIVVPLLAIVLWLSLLTSLTAFVSIKIAMLFGYALAPPTAVTDWVVRMAAAAPFGHFQLTSPTNTAMAAYWGAVALSVAALVMTRHRRAAWAAAGALAIVTIACWSPLDPEPCVVFLDVGHGDAAFIRSPSGETCLIDGGDANEYMDAGKSIVVPFLLSNHVSRLDCVILTHPDRDHIGGLFHVIETVAVGQLILGPAVAQDNDAEQALIALCAARGVPVRRVSRGESLPFAGASLDVLHPPPDWPAGGSANDASLVLRLQWPGMDILFAGDIEAAAEAELCPRIGPADILKVPHHGSNTSSSPDFIDTVQPRVCIVSTGNRGKRESADPAVIEAYRDRGIQVLRTDRDGGITVTARNGKVRYESARAQRGYPVARD